MKYCYDCLSCVKTSEYRSMVKGMKICTDQSSPRKNQWMKRPERTIACKKFK